MTKLKFRFFDTGTQDFSYSCEYGSLSEFFARFQFFGKEETLGRFTGIYDGNTEEVYEDDILSFLPYFKDRDDNKPKIGPVEWSEHDASFRINQYHNGPNWDLHTFCELKEVNKFYVKGNIHQNPELLR